MTTFYTLAFSHGGENNGGNELYPGDIIWDHTSHANSALVIDVNTTSGSWSSGSGIPGGDAAGKITIQVIYGTWTASQYFDADCAGDNTAYIVSLTSIVKPLMSPGLLSTPTISQANYGRFLTSIQVKRSLTDKMYSATLGFDKLEVAGATSGIYWQKLMMWIPDYSGTYNLVFLGFAPSSQSNYTAYGGEEGLTAYSYDYYLKYFLDPLFVTMPWQAGIQTMTPSTFVEGCLGQPLALIGKQWSPSGDWSPYVTGIYPFELNDPDGWDSTMTAIPFGFTTKTTKQAAFDKIVEYTRQIFYCHWYLFGTPKIFTPVAYLIKSYADIDSATTGLGDDLPDPLQVTNGADSVDYPTDGGGYILSPVPLDQKGEDSYNWFTVRGQYPSGAWFQKDFWTTDVYDHEKNPTGTIIKRQYYEENPNINNPTDAYNRAMDLGNYYQQQVMTWQCTFRLRSDLRVYQRVQFFGYTQIPDDTYRIIDINYDYSASGNEIKNEVTVTVVLDSAFRAYLGTMRIFVNPVQEMKNVTDNVLAQTIRPIYGSLLSIDSWQPTITFSSTAGLNYVVTMDSMGSAPTFAFGAAATITGIAGTTVTFTIGITSYSGICAKAAYLNPGNTGKVTSLNAGVTFDTTDLGSGQSYIQTGYAPDSSTLPAIGKSIVATPDQNGKYMVAAT